MKRISLLRAAGASAATVAAIGFPAIVRAADPTKVLIAEPQHNLGYLPLYVAIDQGLFKGLDVSTITLASSGSAHSDAVLTGRAWGFVGGPEHNAFADLRGADIRAVAEIGARGNQYFVAKKNPAPGQDMKAFWKGKTVVTGPIGSSPNNITRFVLAKLGLDPKSDITLMEVDNNSIPVVLSQGHADIAGVREPLLSRGVIMGQWLQPFYSVPAILGPYTFSAINTTYKNIQDTATAQAFVNGIRAAGELMKKDHSISKKITKKEFPRPQRSDRRHGGEALVRRSSVERNGHHLAVEFPSGRRRGRGRRFDAAGSKSDLSDVRRYAVHSAQGTGQGVTGRRYLAQNFYQQHP